MIIRTLNFVYIKAIAFLQKFQLQTIIVVIPYMLLYLLLCKYENMWNLMVIAFSIVRYPTIRNYFRIPIIIWHEDLIARIAFRILRLNSLLNTICYCNVG